MIRYDFPDYKGKPAILEYYFMAVSMRFSLTNRDCNIIVFEGHFSLVFIFLIKCCYHMHDLMHNVEIAFHLCQLIIASGNIF